MSHPYEINSHQRKMQPGVCISELRNSQKHSRLCWWRAALLDAYLLLVGPYDECHRGNTDLCVCVFLLMKIWCVVWVSWFPSSGLAIPTLIFCPHILRLSSSVCFKRNCFLNLFKSEDILPHRHSITWVGEFPSFLLDSWCTLSI